MSQYSRFGKLQVGRDMVLSVPSTTYQFSSSIYQTADIKINYSKPLRDCVSLIRFPCKDKQVVCKGIATNMQHLTKNETITAYC